MTRILIADDNPQNLYLLESILKGNKFTVVSAKNGEEALTRAHQEPPDLLVTDILMPVMDGFELCRQWKANERLKTIPLVFYTATYTDPKDEQFALGLGADRFVVKPQKPEVLCQIINEILAEDQGRRSAERPHLNETETLREYNQVLFRKLEKKVRQLEDEIAEHRRAEEKIRLANRKLALMADVAYQDIQNKVTAALGFAELSRDRKSEEDRVAIIDRQMEVLETIQVLLKNTKDYLRMGRVRSRWLSVEEIIRMQMSLQSQKHSIALSCDLRGLEIFTDPLIARVFYNLIHNAIRHGKTVTRIAFTSQNDPEGLLLICEDDGVGIPSEEKPFLFDRVAGGEGKFGLFFVHEFLTLSGMTIRETGTPGHGARFEVVLPPGMFRFSGSG